MGGFGSGYQGERTAAVEDGLTLSMAELLRTGALVPGAVTSGTWAWSYEGQEPSARIAYVGDMRTPSAATLRLAYTAHGEDVDDVIRLDWTDPQFGGKRWWFLCPLDIKAGRRPRRASKLHLPPGARHFGSRASYGLTYQSRRDSGRHEALWRRLGAELGMSPNDARRAFRAYARKPNP